MDDLTRIIHASTLQVYLTLNERTQYTVLLSYGKKQLMFLVGGSSETMPSENLFLPVPL